MPAEAGLEAGAWDIGGAGVDAGIGALGGAATAAVVPRSAGRFNSGIPNSKRVT
jgi:hypothetical protein